jgi:hypothetical protein
MSIGGIARDATLFGVICFLPTFRLLYEKCRILFILMAVFALWCGFLIASGWETVAQAFGGVRLLACLGSASVAVVLLRLKATKALLPAIIVAGTLCAGLGIADVATNGEVLDELGYREDYGTLDAGRILVRDEGGSRRAGGGISDALDYGYLMGLFTLVFAQLAFRYKSNWARASFVVLTIVCAVSVLLSVTRGAFMALALASLVLAGRRWTHLLGVLAALGLISTLGVIIFPDLADALDRRLVHVDNTTQTSNNDRMTMAQEAIGIIATRPLGVGLGSQGSSASRYAGSGVRPIETDWAVLALALEAGWPGVLLFLSIVLVALFEIYAASGRESLFYVLAFGVYWFFSAQFSNAMINSVNGIMFWLILVSALRTKPGLVAAEIAPSTVEAKMVPALARS